MRADRASCMCLAAAWAAALTLARVPYPLMLQVVARAAQLYSQLLPVQARTPPAAAASAGPAAAAHEGAVAGTAAAAARHGSAGAGAVAAATAARNRWTLEAAATALQEVAQDTIETAAGGQGGPVQQLQVVRPRQEPGPASEGTACVYVLRRADGFFYAGGFGQGLLAWEPQPGFWVGLTGEPKCALNSVAT